MQIRFFPWRWSELQIKIFSYLFCRIFSISYSILHCKMLFENGFKRRIRWRNNGVGATVDSEMKMHWNEEVLRILALHFWGLSDQVSYACLPIRAFSVKGWLSFSIRSAKIIGNVINSRLHSSIFRVLSNYWLLQVPRHKCNSGFGSPMFTLEKLLEWTDVR